MPTQPSPREVRLEAMLSPWFRCSASVAAAAPTTLSVLIHPIELKVGALGARLRVREPAPPIKAIRVYAVPPPHAYLTPQVTLAGDQPYWIEAAEAFARLVSALTLDPNA